jgi:hypothetical protein
VRDTSGLTVVLPARTVTTRYVNPAVALECEGGGIGFGWFHADHRLPRDGYGDIAPDVSGHLRLGGPRFNVAFRFMESAPLEVAPYGQLEVTIRPDPRLELGLGPGFVGPYDGATFGARGRYWLTPEAAVMLRGGFGGGQHWFAAGATARLPRP